MPSTGIPIVDWFLALLGAWGYLIVFGFTVFENLFVIGSFTPGETVVIAASAVAANGDLRLWAVWGASVIGTMTGSFISYAAGRRAGLEAVRSFAERASETSVGRLVRLHPSTLDEVQDHFHTEGAKTVFIARFAIGAKNFVPAIAGATKMPFFWFALYTVLGAIVYTSIMCALGWFVGHNFDRALSIASGVGWVGLLIFGLFVAAIIFGRQQVKARQGRERQDADR